MAWAFRGLIIVAILVVVAWLWLSGNEKQEPAAEPAAVDVPAAPRQPSQPAPTPGPAPDPVASMNSAATPEVDEPAQSQPAQNLLPPPATLNDSDPAFLTMVGSINEELPALLAPPDQIRKWVLFVSLAGNGETSFDHRPFRLPYRKFRVIEEDERLFLDPANYTRFSALIDAVVNIPPQTLVRYYDYWQPLLARAYNDTGEPGSLDARVLAALDQILSAPMLKGSIELKRPTRAMFEFKDPELESASAIHKWLWRVGPDNMSQLQAYFAEVKLLLQQ